MGTHAHQDYIDMRNSVTLPQQDRFAASYRFVQKVKWRPRGKAQAKPSDALRLVWRVYPVGNTGRTSGVGGGSASDGNVSSAA
jgi:hypothetical protein